MIIGSVFSHLSDEDLHGVMQRTSEGIMKLHAMPPEERLTAQGKGNPPQGGFPLLHHFFTGAATEMERRGLLPKGWLAGEA